MAFEYKYLFCKVTEADRSANVFVFSERKVFFLSITMWEKYLHENTIKD